jgi:ubiquinone/menaquinone biosynthesis C-methylase UbiE
MFINFTKYEVSTSNSNSNRVKKVIVNHFERSWPEFVKLMYADKTFGLHLGYYEKGIRTFEEAVINMNNFVEKLLDLDQLDKNNIKILDAGCGVGGTSIYLAKKYPQIKFIGITIVPDQITHANKFALECNVDSNTKFFLGDFCKTGFSDNYFDGAFALESVCYAENKNSFLLEVARILKPNRKLVIIDGFLLEKLSSYFPRIAYNHYCKRWKVANFPILRDFILNLHCAGFEDIKVQDITKNILLFFFIVILKGFADSIRKEIWRKFNISKTEINSENHLITRSSFKYFLIKIFSPLLILFNRKFRYLAIVSRKKTD